MIITAGLLLVAVVAIGYWLLFCRYVAKTSKAIRSLVQLNIRCSKTFSEIRDRKFPLELACKTKTQYDNRPIEYCLAIFMDSHVDDYLPIYWALKYDLIRYDQYLRQYEALRKDIGERSPEGSIESTYKRTEKMLFRRYRIGPPSIRFILRKTYVSPKKRNHYMETKSFFAEDFLKTCDAIFERQERRSKAAKERRRMTAEMRYKVLVRDGFRCVICGRTAADGAILQVDHIKPVSKGGKSTPSNLRTLCSLCNYGKGATYNPKGLN